MSTGTRGEPRRRRLSAAERREVIERAATEVFAERGYHGASMDEIARRSGVSVPVVYDHFASKQALHLRLLERHYAELREIWREHLPDERPAQQRMAQAFDAWFAYVQSHPFAWRMLFRDTTGDPDIAAFHREVQVASRAEAMRLFVREPGVERLAGSAEYEALEMAWEVFRGVLQSLALWWYEHQHVAREEIVAMAMNALWVGFERVGRGERWEP